MRVVFGKSLVCQAHQAAHLLQTQKSMGLQEFSAIIDALMLGRRPTAVVTIPRSLTSETIASLARGLAKAQKCVCSFYERLREATACIRSM